MLGHIKVHFKPIRSDVILWLVVLALAASTVFFAARTVSDSNAIQASRLAACEAQNEHHDHTIAFLNRLAAKEEKGQSAAKVAQIQHSLKLYYILIQDEIPKLDCRVVISSS